MCKRRIMLLAGTSLLAATTAMPAAAQAVLEEIIVTAQKRSQSISEVGLTIQAATGDMLSQLGIEGPADLSKLVPGFSYTESLYSTPVFTLRGVGLYDATFSASPAVAVYTDQVPRNFPVMSEALDLDLERVEVLKGPQGTLFGQSATGGAINYITAKPTRDPQAGLDLSYERFGKADLSGFVSGPLSETVRARLAARAVEGGAWQYSQSRPDDRNGDARKLMGRLSVDWDASEKLTFQASATGARDRSDPQAPQYVASVFNIYSAAALATANASPATRNPYGVVDDGLYASMTTPGSANYDASFLARQQTLVSRMNGSDPAVAGAARALLGTPAAPGSARAAEWTPDFLRRNNNDYYQGTLRADYELTDEVKLTSISAYAKQTLDYVQDLDGTVAQGVDVPLFGNVKVFNQELRLSGDSERLNWLAGASYDHSKSSQSNYFRLGDYSGNAPIPGLAPISLTLNDFTSRLETYAGFANVQYKLTPQLSVSGGLRYTSNDQKASYCYNDPPIDTAQGAAGTFSIFQGLFTGQNLPAIKPGECFPLGDGLSGTTFGKSTLTPVERSLKQDNWSYRAGVDYKFDQGTLLYATVSQGYKTGIFSAIGASSTSQYAPAVQEKVVSYEAGVKAPLFDHSVNFNGAAFYYDYTNKQVRGRILDSIYGLLEKLVNVPESYVWGLEGELMARPVEGLTLTASGTYLKSRVSGSFRQTIDGSDVYNAAGYTGDFKGSTLPFTPKFSGNIDIQYEWDVAADFTAFVGGTLSYQGSQNTTFENAVLLADDYHIGSYSTTDLRAGLGAADDRWKVTLYGRNVFNKTYTTSISTYLDTRFRFTGRPAIYGVSLRVRYD